MDAAESKLFYGYKGPREGRPVHKTFSIGGKKKRNLTPPVCGKKRKRTRGESDPDWQLKEKKKE